MLIHSEYTDSPMTLDSMITMFGLTSTQIDGQTWILDSEYTSNVIETLLDSADPVMVDSGLLLDDWTMGYCADCEHWFGQCEC